MKVGRVILVMLSLLSGPSSSAVIRSGVLGALGGVVSMITVKVVEATLVLPATSDAVAVKTCDPSLSVPVLGKVHVPLVEEATVPRE